MKAFMVAAIVLLAACADATSDPEARPGELIVSLRSAGEGPALGAIRFTVSGGDIAQVTAAEPGVTVFTSSVGDEVSVVAIGATLQGALVRLRVPDVRKMSNYRTHVVEMVDTENGKVAASEVYGLMVAR